MTGTAARCTLICCTASRVPWGRGGCGLQGLVCGALLVRVARGVLLRAVRRAPDVHGAARGFTVGSGHTALEIVWGRRSRCAVRVGVSIYLNYLECLRVCV